MCIEVCKSSFDWEACFRFVERTDVKVCFEAISMSTNSMNKGKVGHEAWRLFPSFEYDVMGS
jgi:hypothetical protein